MKPNAVLVAVCCALAWAAQANATDDKTYTIALNPKQGQSFKYRITTASQGGRVNASSDMLFTVLALKVDPKQITFKTVANKMLVTMNGGQPQDMSKGLGPIVQVTDRQGNVLKQTGGASGGAPIIPSNLPAKPVKVGDTWSNKFHDVGNEFKLVGIKNEKGRQVALIQVAAYSRNGKTVTPGVMRIDLATGMLLNYELKISNGRLTTTSSLQQIK